MKTLMRWIASAFVLLASMGAGAAITCGITSGGFSTAYDPASALTNVSAATFTVTCTRGSAADPLSVNYSVTVDNGLYALGINNRAAFGTNRIRYDVFTNSTCGATWKGGTAISGTITFSGTGTVSQQGNFWGCVAAGISSAAGTYTDTITMTMSYGATPASTATGSFGVSISTPSTCTLSTAPGNVVFNYTSFGPAINPSATFGVTCTLSLPYTMALATTSGTIVGLNYTLALSTASSTGTGVQQTHSINGSMVAGQGGICATATCSGSQANTLTITY
jgi:spore coat protein U-like protein